MATEFVLPILETQADATGAEMGEVNGNEVPVIRGNRIVLYDEDVDGNQTYKGSVLFGQVDNASGGLDTAPELVIASTTIPTAQQHVAYSHTFVATGGAPPYTYTVVAGLLPSDLVLSSGGVLSGTPLSPIAVTSGSNHFTLRVTDADGNTADTVVSYEGTLLIDVFLPTPVIGVAYNGSVENGPAGFRPYSGAGVVTYDLLAGGFPEGLTFHEDTGVVDGTPAPGAESIAYFISASAGNQTIILEGTTEPIAGV